MAIDNQQARFIWSQDKIDWLKSNYQHKTNAELANELGATTNAVRQQMSKRIYPEAKLQPLPDGFIQFNANHAINKRANVLNINTKRFVRQKQDKYGYIFISANGVYSLHRLMAKTFLPNPLNKPQVNHIDGNKANNCLANLEWCTASENIKHAYKIGLYDKLKTLWKGENNANAKLNEQQVREIRAIGRTMSQIDIANKYNVSRSLISLILNNKIWPNV